MLLILVKTFWAHIIFEDIILHKTVKTNDKIRRFGVFMTPLSRKILKRSCKLQHCNLHDLFNIFLDNRVMNTPKRRILSLVFTVLCFKKSLLIRT